MYKRTPLGLKKELTVDVLVSLNVSFHMLLSHGKSPQ